MVQLVRLPVLIQHSVLLGTAKMVAVTLTMAGRIVLKAVTTLMVGYE